MRRVHARATSLSIASTEGSPGWPYLLRITASMRSWTGSSAGTYSALTGSRGSSSAASRSRSARAPSPMAKPTGRPASTCRYHQELSPNAERRYGTPSTTIDQIGVAIGAPLCLVVTTATTSVRSNTSTTSSKVMVGQLGGPARYSAAGRGPQNRQDRREPQSAQHQAGEYIGGPVHLQEYPAGADADREHQDPGGRDPSPQALPAP